MAESRIKINTNMLNRDIQSIESYLANIEKTIKNMNTEVAQLDAMWDGDANEAFNKEFQDDIRELEKLCKSVKDIINYEKNARAQYDSCEAKVGSLVGEIKI